MAAEKSIHRFRRWFISLMFVGLGALLIWMMVAPRAVDVELVTVRRGQFDDILKAEGYVRSKDRYLITAYADGRLDRVTLKVGDTVKKNQVLTHLTWDYKMAVRSPIDGVVAKVFREAAGPIARTQAIMEIIDPNDLEVVVELLTVDAARVQTGNRLQVSGWGGKEILEARVTRVSQAGFKKISALGVEEERTEVIADWDTVPAAVSHLGDQFHVDTQLTVQSLADVLTVPVGALFREGTQWAVFREMNGRAVQTIVQLSYRSASEAVVTNGLSEGERVILYPGDLVKDGVRLKTKPLTP